MPDLAVDMIVQGGIGLVNPNQGGDFYEAMHSYLADVGINGVKVDVTHSLEYVCEDYGGRVQLAKAYYDGLTKSLKKNLEELDSFQVMTSGLKSQMDIPWEFTGCKEST
ncbi:hypothetical protein GH714_039785 [Hevea brasiliensis]|uniref:Uncharacterized protein n=1 Tax=Hevea brasiliensis TaxID=3981 RepID=A0A6A6MID8_HEVBR|nr:hypothetical protein GH714_039785 [Hevea brasiliensis]